MRPLSIIIDYAWKTRTFEVSGDVNPESRPGIVDDFLRRQLGTGEDTRQAADRDVYRIELVWGAAYDSIRPTDNIGNNGLRDGILYEFLTRYDPTKPPTRIPRNHQPTLF